MKQRNRKGFAITKRIVMIVVSVLCFAFGFAACGGSGANGTYYLYENGSLDRSQSVTIDGSKWTDDDGETGEVKISGETITLYVEFFGEKEEFASGTVKDGVLTLNIMGAEIVYCKDGKTPSGGNENGGNKNPSAQTYTVTYDANGGTFADGSNQLTQNNVQENSLLTAPTSPEKTGSTFGGWATSAKGSALWKFATDTVTKNMTLYAVWNEEAAAIISIDGASISERSVFMLVEEDVEYVSLSNKVVCTSGSTWRLYYDRLGLTEIATKIAAQTSGSLYDGDNTFYIVVTSSDGTQVNTYELTVHRSYAVSVKYYDNKNNLLDSETVYTGNEFTANYTPNITGYTFNGWKNGNGKTFTSDTLWNSLSLYADCTANTYTAALDVNGGNELAATEKTVTYDKEYSFIVPKRTGYSFLGWYVGNTQITDEKGASLTEWDFTSDKTFIAKWQANDYAVTLNVNDKDAGTVTGAGDYQYGRSVTITAKTNKGYTFIGWYDGNGNLITADLTYTFTVGFSVTYTAKWTYYTVTADKTEGGSVTSYNNKKVSVGETVKLTATTDLAYTFIGWYNGETKLTDELSYTFSMLAENVTYTAKWKLDEQFADFKFTSTPTICKITGIKDKSVTKIVIPDSVTSIDSSAFSGCSSLTSVTIGNSVTSIGQYAFSGCSSLSEITLPFIGASKDGKENTHFGYIFGASSCDDNSKYVPSSLKKVIITSATKINDFAFWNCSSLTSITIPDSVTTIGSYAFSGCGRLVEVINKSTLKISKGSTENGCVAYYALYVHNGTSKIVNKDGFLFITDEDNVNYLLGYTGAATELTLPKDYNGKEYAIYQDAFRNCSSLTSVTIGNGVTSIGSSAFENCSSLTSITIPDGVTSIGSSAFENCSSLTSITIPDGVTSIGSAAFYDCSSLTSITIPDGVTSIGSSAFENCSSLTSITIPDGVTSIGSSAFYMCSSLTSITIPDSVTSIGYRAFYKCSSLTSITIPDSVTSIGQYAFDYCSSLSEITLPFIGASKDGKENTHFGYIFGASSFNYNSNVPSSLKKVIITSATKINDSAFYKCSSLTSVTIGNSVTSIGSSAFFNCSSLTSVTIGNSVTSIGYRAFYKCSSLTSVTIGNSVTSIGSSAFYDCSSLTSITIPDSVTSIGSSAFYDCSSLTSITIPDSVTSIGSAAFESCSSLTSVTFENTAGWYVTKNASWTSGTNVTVTNSSKNATYLTSTYTGHYWKRG